MPTLVEDLADGLKLTFTDGEKIQLSRAWDAQDLTGLTPTATFASALTLPGLPKPTDPIQITDPRGKVRTLWPANYSLDPFPPADARVTIGYSERDLSIAGSDEFGKCTISGGTSVRQIDTEFDAENLAKPFLQRTPIFVAYDPTQGALAGGGSGAIATTTVRQGGSVSAFIPESSITFTRFERSAPDGRSREYGGKRNAAPYRGCAANTLLIWSVTFDQIANDLFTASYTMVYDPYMFWNQILRYIDPLTGQPPRLTQTQLAGQNGIKEVETQQSVAFQPLQLVVA